MTLICFQVRATPYGREYHTLLPKKNIPNDNSKECNWTICRQMDKNNLKNLNTCTKIISFIAAIESSIIIPNLHNVKHCEIWCKAYNFSCDKEVLKTLNKNNNEISSLAFDSEFLVHHSKEYIQGNFLTRPLHSTWNIFVINYHHMISELTLFSCFLNFMSMMVLIFLGICEKT